MGEDKALLDWGGVPLVAHVCGQVRRAIDGPLVLVAAEGQELPLLEGVERVTDRVAQQGPLEGLRTGLAALASRADAAFVASVDAPHLRPELARALIARLGEADAVLPASGGLVHPLTAVYRTSLAVLAGELLDSGERRARALSERCRTKVLERTVLLEDESLRLADPELRSLGDVDTPADLEAARAR